MLSNTMSLKTSTTYTLEEFISAGRRNKITYDFFSYKDLLTNGTEVTILDTIDDYMDEFKEGVVRVRLSDEEYRKYRYKPKLLCHDVYGNGEIYFVILLLNGIIDIKEFDFREVKMLPKETLSAYLSSVYNAESKWMNQYNATHGTDT